MKIPVKSVADIGQAIRMTRISQDLDQLTAAELSGSGQSFLSHLENGKETAQIGKVLQMLASLGIKVELTLPPDVDALLDKYNENSNSSDRNIVREAAFLKPSDPSVEKSKLSTWEKALSTKRVRRS